jgi:uncharacterized protein DUF6998
VYSSADLLGENGAMSAPNPRTDDAIQPAPDPDRLATRSTRDLLRLYGSVLTQLRARGIVRSENSPVGDYAEYLAARAFGLTLVVNSGIGYDGIDANGIKYQVKARRMTPWNKSRQLGAIRGLGTGADPFDQLVAILFEPEFGIQRAALMPIRVVRSMAKRHEYVNAWRFMLTDAIWKLPGVQDVTSWIVEAAG